MTQISLNLQIMKRTSCGIFRARPERAPVAIESRALGTLGLHPAASLESVEDRLDVQRHGQDISWASIGVPLAGDASCGAHLQHDCAPNWLGNLGCSPAGRCWPARRRSGWGARLRLSRRCGRTTRLLWGGTRQENSRFCSMFPHYLAGAVADLWSCCTSSAMNRRASFQGMWLYSSTAARCSPLREKW